MSSLQADVTVTLFDLAQLDEAAFAAYQTDAIYQAAEGITGRRAQRRYIKSRLALMQVLSDLTEARPSDLAFDISQEGKPFLSSHPEVHFNISHAGERLLIATASFPIGVDLEGLDADAVSPETASMVFSPEEFRLFEWQDAPSCLELFYLLWTKKEAYLKAVGHGFLKNARDVTVHQKGSRLLHECKEWRNGRALSNWRALNLNVGPGYQAALAMEGERAVIAYRQYVTAEDMRDARLPAAYYLMPGKRSSGAALH